MLVKVSVSDRGNPMLCSPFPPQTGGAQVIIRMQVAVTPTAIDRRAITTPKGTSPDQWLLELPQPGGDRHRQRQFESPSDWFQLTVTHFMSSGLRGFCPLSLTVDVTCGGYYQPRHPALRYSLLSL